MLRYLVLAIATLASHFSAQAAGNEVTCKMMTNEIATTDGSKIMFLVKLNRPTALPQGIEVFLTSELLGEKSEFHDVATMLMPLTNFEGNAYGAIYTTAGDADDFQVELNLDAQTVRLNYGTFHKTMKISDCQ